MEYLRFENTIVLCLERGEKILASIADVCEKERVTLASISGAGRVQYAKLSYFQSNTHQSLTTIFNKDMELASLTGSVNAASLYESRVALTVHAVLGDEYGNAFAGFLNEAVLSSYCEIFISCLPGRTRGIETRFEHRNY